LTRPGEVREKGPLRWKERLGDDTKKVREQGEEDVGLNWGKGTLSFRVMRYKRKKAPDPPNNGEGKPKREDMRLGIPADGRKTNALEKRLGYGMDRTGGRRSSRTLSAFSELGRGAWRKKV